MFLDTKSGASGAVSPSSLAASTWNRVKFGHWGPIVRNHATALSYHSRASAGLPNL